MKICIEFFWIPSIHNFPRKIFTNLIKSILINLKRKSFDKVYLCIINFVFNNNSKHKLFYQFPIF